MQRTLEDIIGGDTRLTSEERSILKRKMTEKIVEIYLEEELSVEMRELVIGWLLDDEGAEIKEEAIMKHLEGLL